jgi:AraC family transcriptional regulator of adaptative response/methylated-DNA-[protein]-cysteine methyltransferase
MPMHPDASAPPATPHVALVAELCRHIERAGSPPTLGELAAKAGLSRYYVHRVFKAVTGVTPNDYARSHRAQRLRETLAGAESVTQAIYDAGYATSSRFYAESAEVLGMTPTAYRAGGVATEIRFAIGQSSLGAILVAQSTRGVCAILLGDDPEVLLRDLQDRFPKAHLIGGDADFEQTVARVVAFIEAPRIGLSLPLDLRGTAFQLRVWQALRDIPVGQTASYSDIAQRIGAPTSVRAVARACAANPVALAVPCHRVLRIDGGISGYRWGVERKRTLLAREASGAERS